MARFSQYLDQYPDILPGDVRGSVRYVPFEDVDDQGSFFQEFLKLQNNPTKLLMEKVSLPQNLQQFMSMGGIQ